MVTGSYDTGEMRFVFLFAILLFSDGFSPCYSPVFMGEKLASDLRKDRPGVLQVLQVLHLSIYSSKTHCFWTPIRGGCNGCNGCNTSPGKFPFPGKLPAVPFRRQFFNPFPVFERGGNCVPVPVVRGLETKFLKQH